MAKDKATVNPAQAQRKLEKQRALKKGKADVAARRNERLAHRNPDRLVRQIEELRSFEASGQALKPRDKRVLEGLEKDVRAVKKAREALGDHAPQFTRSSKTTGNGARGCIDGGLGKRKREAPWISSEGDTDDDVRKIPMPKDTPPPLPPRLAQNSHNKNANLTPLGGNREVPRLRYSQTESPQSVAQNPTRTVYEAAPAVRDLRMEAINAFVPNAVQKKVQQIRGQGRLLEPAELDNLQMKGYGGASQPLCERGDRITVDKVFLQTTHGINRGMVDIDEEEKLFDNEIRGVGLEDFSDRQK